MGGGEGALQYILLPTLADREVRRAELGLLPKKTDPHCDEPRQAGRMWNVGDS